MITCFVFCQKHQMVITAALAFLCQAGTSCHINLTADDGLDAHFFRRLVKLNGTIHGTMVCDGDAVHAQLFDTLYQFFDFRGTVQKAVFRMDMKMCKRSLFSCLYFLFHIK